MQHKRLIAPAHDSLHREKNIDIARKRKRHEQEAAVSSHLNKDVNGKDAAPRKKRRTWSSDVDATHNSTIMPHDDEPLSASSLASSTSAHISSEHDAYLASVHTKEDVKKLHLYNEKMRDFVVQQLGLVLGERSKWQSAQRAAKLAVQIEQAMMLHFDEDPKSRTYKEQFNALRFNIRDQKNDNFWQRIWNEETDAEELAKMHSIDMAANAKKEEREKLAQDFLIQSIKPEDDIRDVDILVCEKCGHKNLLVVHHEDQSLGVVSDRSLLSATGAAAPVLESGLDEDKDDEQSSSDETGKVQCKSCGVDLVDKAPKSGTRE